MSQNPYPKPEIKPPGISGFTKTLYFAHFAPDFRQKQPNLIVTVFGNNQIFTGNTITGNGKIFLAVLPLPSTTLGGPSLESPIAAAIFCKELRACIPAADH